MKIIGILIGILGFLLLITFHELGHFVVAKLCKIQVNEFSVGMGPLIFQTHKNGTDYSFRAFPIGGYCALEGEDEETDNPNAFKNAAFWKQVLVLVAGSFINFVLGFLIIFFVYVYVAQGQATLLRLFQVTFYDCTDLYQSIIQFLAGLFNGTSDVNDVSGVVGIVAVVAEVAEIGLLNIFYLIGLLSVNLSIMNMLPIPGLDGGRIFVGLIKWISKGKLSEKAENIINAIGMVFLIGIMVLLIIKDTVALIRG